MTSSTIAVSNLSMDFPLESGIVAGLSRRIKREKLRYLHAVRGVTFVIKKGQTLGLVGESGCGKSTLGKTMLRLYEPTLGHIYFDERDITTVDQKTLRKLRPKMQMVFQDPFSSLNPRMKVRDIVGHALEAGNTSTENKEAILRQLMEMVGLSIEHMDRYPHQFSGGQRQRIAIARALATNPTFLVADEPVSALDVSVQSHVINLIRDLQKRLDLTILFITHDLSVARYLSTKVAVMYMGKIVEMAETEELFDQPLHPYTKALLTAVPVPDPRLRRERILLKGEPPSPLDLPQGCTFQSRCVHAKSVCVKAEPEMINVGNDHLVACYLYDSSESSK